MTAKFSVTRVTAFWGRLNSRFWYVSSVMAVAAEALSFLLSEVDALRGVDRRRISGGRDFDRRQLQRERKHGLFR